MRKGDLHVKNLLVWLMVGIGGMTAATAWAEGYDLPCGSNNCSGHHNHGCGNKICRVICETKKVKEVKYKCECEDFCVPGPSENLGKVCETDECGKVHHRIQWRPGCAEVYTKTKLIKYEETKEVPSWKWVVEEVPCCAPCQAGCCAALAGARTQHNSPVFANQTAPTSEEAVVTSDPLPPSPTALNDGFEPQPRRRMINPLQQTNRPAGSR